MDFIDGVRLNDLEALDAMSVDRHHLVETITKAYAHQIFLDGFFNADPHAGTVLHSAGGWVGVFSCRLHSTAGLRLRRLFRGEWTDRMAYARV